MLHIKINIYSLSLILLLFLFLPNSPAISGTILLDRSLDKIHVGPHIEVLEDKQGTLTINEVQNNDKKYSWASSKKKKHGFGFTKSAYWARFTVVNNTEKDIEFNLEQVYPLIDNIKIYQIRNNSVLDFMEAGDLMPFPQRHYDYRTFVFPLKIASGESYEYYIRYKTEGSMNIHLTIWSPPSFKKKSAKEYHIFMLYTGSIMVMVVYNLFMFLFIRRIEYLYYVLFISFLMIFFMTQNGTAFQFLWPGYPGWANLCIPRLLCLVIITGSLFTMEFLAMQKEYPLCFNIGRGIIFLSVICLILSFFLSYMYMVIASSVIAGGYAALILASGVWMLMKKHRPAYFYLTAWGALLLGAILYILKSAFSILPENFINNWSLEFLQIGFLAMVVLFSIALADHINIMRKDLESLAEELENRVKERTRKLKETQTKLIEKAYKAGMADIATETIHNIGNILNSVSTSTNFMNRVIDNSYISGLKKANDLLREKKDTIEDFIINDPKGKKLFDYFIVIEDEIEKEQGHMKHHLTRLNNQINTISEVINAQQIFAESEPLIEKTHLEDIVEDVLTMQTEMINKSNITVIKKMKHTPEIQIQRSKLQFVLVSLINNANDAMLHNSPSDREITISTDYRNSEVFLKLKDTGHGISDENMKKIFAQGFTTRKGRKGFSLHSSANFIAEMGGSIRAENTGHGTEFILNFPEKPDSQNINS